MPRRNRTPVRRPIPVAVDPVSRRRPTTEDLARRLVRSGRRSAQILDKPYMNPTPNERTEP